MSNFSGTRTLKRQASSDDEITPVKQARTSVQNTHARRLPPLRRSDSQALDINATKAVVEHLPPNVEPVPVPSEFHQHRGDDQDMAGSTDSDSQDEDGAWDRRAKAHRHAMLFKRPREPQPKIMCPAGSGKISGVAFMDGSDSDSDNGFSMGGEVAAKRVQQLMALRAARAAAPKRPRAPAASTSGSVAQSNSSAAAKSQASVTTTTHRVTRTSSRTVVTTSTSVSQRVEEIDSRSVSCPTRAPSGAAPRVAKAPSVLHTQAGPSGSRPQRQNSRVRQNAIDAIAGHSANNSSVSALTALSATSSLSSMSSLILRRSRRNQASTSKQL